MYVHVTVVFLTVVNIHTYVCAYVRTYVRRIMISACTVPNTGQQVTELVKDLEDERRRAQQVVHCACSMYSTHVGGHLCACTSLHHLVFV